MELGTKIKLARLKNGLTQKQLADKISKARPLISHIEQTGKVNYYTLRDICDVLKISIENFEPLTSNIGGNLSKIDTRIVRKQNRFLKQEVNALKEIIDSQQEVIKELQQKK
jgi:transcriptional regulator with XRE-family HTH domain